MYQYTNYQNFLTKDKYAIFQCVKVEGKTGYGILKGKQGIVLACEIGTEDTTEEMQILGETKQFSLEICDTLKEGHCYMVEVSLEQDTIKLKAIRKIKDMTFSYPEIEDNILNATPDEIGELLYCNQNEVLQLEVLQKFYGITYKLNTRDIHIKTKSGTWWYIPEKKELLHEHFHNGRCGGYTGRTTKRTEMGWHKQKMKYTMSSVFDVLAYIAAHDYGYHALIKSKIA